MCLKTLGKWLLNQTGVEGEQKGVIQRRKEKKGKRGETDGGQEELGGGLLCVRLMIKKKKPTTKPNQNKEKNYRYPTVKQKILRTKHCLYSGPGII